MFGVPFRVAIGGVVAAGLLALTAAPALGAEYDPNVTVKVEGSYHASSSNHAGVGDSSSAEISWNETVTGPLDDIAFGVVSGSSAHGALSVSYSASGELTATYPSPHESESCSAKLSGVGGSVLALGAPFTGESAITVEAVAPLSPPHIHSEKTSGNCQLGETQSYTVFGDEEVSSDPRYTAWLTPAVHTYAGAGPVSETFSFSDSGKSGAGTGHSEGTETITFQGAPAIPGVGPPGKSGSGESPSGGGGETTATKAGSERRRAELKLQAQQDLRPALIEDWGAHGLSGVLGVVGSLAIGAAADDIGGAASIYEGNDATIRVINDYRIYNDPASSEYKSLAEPHASARPSLPSCSRFHAVAATYCAALRRDESSLLAQAGRVAAIGGAQVKTIDRDSAAIAAGDYAAAETQAGHFENLRAMLTGALKKQRQAAGPVAALLARAHVPAAISKARSGPAIKWLQQRLAGAGISAAALKPLAGSALTAQSTAVKSVLAGG